MDKQNMNLEQLYKERFQSFEMNQDSEINLRMKQKLRHLKTMQWIKWIAIGLLAATAALMISLWSFSAKQTQSQTLSTQASLIEDKYQEKTIKTKKTSMTLNTQEVAFEENNTIMNDPSSDPQTPLHEAVKFEEDQHRDGGDHFQSSADEMEITKPAFPKTQSSVSYSAHVREEYRLESPLALIDSKSRFLIISKHHQELGEKRKDLKTNDDLISKSKGNKSKVKNYSERLEFESKPGQLDLFMDIHFSPLFWNNSSKVIDIGIVSDWSSSINHQAQLSYEMGFSFQLHHQKTPLFLQLGLDYQVLKEKIDDQISRIYEDPELSSWEYDSIFDIQTVVDTFYVIIDSNQFVIDTLFTQDTLLMGIDSSFIVVMTTEEKSKKQVNTYSYLNIPLMLGYEFNTHNERWSFQVLAGGALAINLNNKGYYYRGGDDFESYSGKVSPSFIWSLQAAANINYRWKKWQFYVQPEFQYQLNDSRVYEFAPSRKYQFYKVKAGIRFQLF